MEQLSDEDLILRQLALECVGVTAERRLIRIPCADPDDMPRCLCMQHGTGHSLYVRDDVPPAICAQLLALPPAQAFQTPELVTAILAADVPCTSVWHGASYVFPALTAPPPPQVVRLEERHRALIDRYNPALRIAGRAVWAAIDEGQIVATCESSREDARAGEAWVQTLPAFRRRGHARAVTAAWARALQQAGKTPFYSHHRDNLASAAVARSLGLRRFVSIVGSQ